MIVTNKNPQPDDIQQITDFFVAGERLELSTSGL